MLMRTVPGRSCVSVAENNILRTLGRVVEGEEKAGAVLLGLHRDGAFNTLLSIRILDLS